MEFQMHKQSQKVQDSKTKDNRLSIRIPLLIYLFSQIIAIYLQIGITLGQATQLSKFSNML